jgi:two-component system C4-dicarboxylate transport sensor histidine kinase DctB
LHLLQDELVQANKLAVLGQVATGVAHEINQPVAAIRSYVDSAAAMLARGSLSLVNDNLAAVAALTERIGRITSELKSFARKSSATPTAVDVDDAIDGALLLLGASLRAGGIEVERRASAIRVRALAERIRLEQVVVNLLQNAIDALADHTAPRIQIAVETDAARVRIMISDNGPGLTEQVAAALFQPFVTTKPQGLGLGLVISRDILAEFGGVLELVRTGPDGAAFTIGLKRKP